MPPVKHVVIGAAGIGSRLGLNRPKCLVDVAGRTLIDYHLERLAWAETVWIVVGFQEEEVAAHALALRRDVIIVRNPDFARTNTLQSIHRVARHLRERFLVVDADTVIEPESFSAFVDAAGSHEQLIGISDYTTSDGVRVILDETGNAVTGFSRDPRYPLEWTGVAVIEPRVIVDRPLYVYEALAPHLPIPAFRLDAFDIDTAADLDMARHVVDSGWRRRYTDAPA